MKKMVMGFIVVVVSYVQFSHCLEFNYTFINRTGRWIKLLVIERGNPSFGIACRAERHSIDLNDKETKPLTTRCCLVQVNTDQPQWQMLWKNHLVPKCKGTAVVTKKGEGYVLQWK